MDDFLDNITEALSNSAVDLSTVSHDIAGIIDALDSIGINAAELTNEQIEYLLDYLDDPGAETGSPLPDNHRMATGNSPVKFGNWEQGSSGTYYEKVNGQYTGNWSNG